MNLKYYTLFQKSTGNWSIIHLCQQIIQSSKHFLNAFSRIDLNSCRELSFMSSIDWKRVPRSGDLSFGKRNKSAGAISGEYRWLFDDIRWVFGQKFVHYYSLVRWSFGTSQAVTPFMPKESFKTVLIDSWDTESSAAISLKLIWRFSDTISFTLAMLTSIEDVDGRPGRVKSSNTSRPLLKCTVLLICTWDKLTTSSTVNKLNVRSPSNSTSV